LSFKCSTGFSNNVAVINVRYGIGGHTMEEMSTREIIETVIKGRATIIGLTVICIAVGLVVNVFILEPVYEAETMLMISPISQKMLMLKQ